MLTLILLLVFGSGIAFLALQNTVVVPLTFLTYTIPQLPLYAIIIGSLLAGIFLAYIISLVHSISTSLTIHSKDKKIQKEKKEVNELTRKVHQLELENARIKKDNDPKSSDPRSM